MLIRPLTHKVLMVLAAASLVAGSPAGAQEYEGKAVVAARPWARATPGGSTIGAAYVELSGIAGGPGDKLVGAASPVAGRVEVHTHISEDGVMKMRKVDAVEIAAGQSRNLAPGGDHIMLFDLKAPLKQGETFPLTLKFEASGEITVDTVVEAVGAMGPNAASGGTSAGDAADQGSDAGSQEGSHEGSHDGH